MNWYKKSAKQKYRKDIPKSSQGGDCYYVAGHYLMDNARNNPNLILVHGEVSGQKQISGIRYGHAWIEDGDMIIDNSNGRNLKIPKMIYYSIGNIEPDKTFRYNIEQMRRKILDTGHWGPWDLQAKY